MNFIKRRREKEKLQKYTTNPVSNRKRNITLLFYSTRCEYSGTSLTFALKNFSSLLAFL